MAKKKRTQVDEVAPNDRAELHEQTRSFTVEGGKTTTLRVRVNVRESWLEYALHRHWIDQRQYQAGMALRDAFERSSMHTEKAVDYSKERVDVQGHNDAAMVDRMDMARYVVSCIVAIDRIEYPLGQVCRRVAIEGQSSRKIARIYRWRDEKAMVYVKAALDAMADHQDRHPAP